MSSSAACHSSHVQSIVIGAGVVGLSVARLLARAGQEVLVVDKAPRIGSGTSSRNSAVVHAGLHYERGSLKASTCVEGSWMLRRFCDLYKVPIDKCGKLVVATDKVQDSKLQMLYTKATGLGARDLVLLDGVDARKFEPSLSQKVIGALWSPHTAVIDTAALCDALVEDGRTDNRSFMVCPGNEVTGIQLDQGGKSGIFKISFSDQSTLSCDRLVNAAGLHARDVSALISNIAPRQLPKIGFVKGSYFSLSNKYKNPFHRLIYPTATGGGHLGVHVTKSVADGVCRLGPDFEPLNITSLPKDLNSLLHVNPESAQRFHDSVADYWEDAPPVSALEPDFAGIRPQTSSKDFLLDQHGIHNYIALYGIDSPGLTASLSLAHRVCDMLQVPHVVTPEMLSTSHKYEWEL